VYRGLFEIEKNAAEGVVQRRVWFNIEVSLYLCEIELEDGAACAPIVQLIAALLI